MRTTHWILVISLLSLALGGCGGSVATESPNLKSSNPQEVGTEESLTELPENPIQLESTLEATHMSPNSLPIDKFVQIAKQDLADVLKIDIDQVTVIEAVEIIWPDAALGCPSPGKVYASGLVPGYQVKLEANGVEYDYHMDQTGQYVLCPNFDENVPPNSATPGQTQSVDPGVPIR